MLTYLSRRLMLMIPTLLGITIVVFSVIALAPGKPGQMLLDQAGNMRADERATLMAYLNQRYGLDRPAYIQYLRWLNNISPIGFKTWHLDDPEVKAALARAAAEPRDAKGKPARPKPSAGDVRLDRPTIKWPDLGNSMAARRPVGPLILEALPVTITLQLIALPLAYTIALSLGVIAAKNRGQLADYGIGTALLGLWALPSMWVGVMLIGFLANSEWLQLFPAANIQSLNAPEMSFLPSFQNGFSPGWLLDRLYHVVLPVLCLTYANFAFLTKLTRSALLDTLAADFVRTARAKGLPERVVLFRHAFRNSLLPLITVAASLLPAMITGSVIIETIFSIPGMGKLAIDSIRLKDQEAFLSITLISSLLTLTGYLLADIAYTIADPRVSYE